MKIGGKKKHRKQKGEERAECCASLGRASLPPSYPPPKDGCGAAPRGRGLRRIPPPLPPGPPIHPPPPHRRSPTAAHGLATRAWIRRRLPERPRGRDSLQREPTHAAEMRCRAGLQRLCGVHRVPGAGGCGGSVPADCCRLPALPSRR